MTYEVEIQFTGWATKTVKVPALSEAEAKVFALAIAQATPSDELAWVLENAPYDIHVEEV
jgi:hypothetical protein